MSRRILTRTLNGQITTNYSKVNPNQGIVTSVFGCTGNLGIHVAHAVGRMGSTLMLPYRFRSSTFSSVRIVRDIGDGTYGQVYYTDFELDKEFVVKAALEKSEHVINCIGAWIEPAWYEIGSTWFSMEAVNIEWPRMLARWSREMGIDRFVHVSMVGADVNSPSALLRQKALAEQAVLEEFPRATIVRPTTIFFEEDKTYTLYYRMQKYFKIVPVPNHGLHIHQPVFAGDVACAIARAVHLKHTQGRIAELGGPIRFTTNDLMTWLADVNDYLDLTVHVPKCLWKIPLFMHERMFRRSGALGSKAPMMTRDWLDRQWLDDCALPERDPELLDWEDLGIAHEDLFRLEEKHFIPMHMYARDGAWSWDRLSKL